MVRIRASTVQLKREEVYAALQHAANFHCLVEWHDCEELGSKPQKKVYFREHKRGRRRRHHGMVCGYKHVSLHDMWEEQ